MHRTNLIPLAATFLTLASFGLADSVLAGERLPDLPAAETLIQQAPSASEVEASEPVPAASGGVCGLTAAQVADIIGHYELEPDGPAMSAALEAPFNCEAYGQLCQVAGSPQKAHNYACDVWLNMEAHVPLVEVQSAAVITVNEWGPCEPEWPDCEDICGSRPVASCSGVAFNGKCNAIAMCDWFTLPYEIPFFDFLGPVI